MTRWLVTLLLVCSTGPSLVQAERLPIKTYTTADGLAHNRVNRIVPDSRGFLWFCTREGLSRFDGSSFTTYGLEDGLPSAAVNDLIEARDGTYWIATAQGLVRFDPLGTRRGSSGDSQRSDRPMFTVHLPPGNARTRRIEALLQDRAGTLWVGTLQGLYQMSTGTGNTMSLAPADLDIPDELRPARINSLAEDSVGALWIGTPLGLHRRLRDGRIETYRLHDGPTQDVESLLFDRAGYLWVSARGLVRLTIDQTSGRVTGERRYDTRDGLPSTWLTQLTQTSEGHLWAASIAGLVQFLPSANGTSFTFRAYSRPHGLPHEEVQTIVEDGHRNLWIGTSAGAAKILQDGPVVFGADDGLAWALTITETQRREPLVIGGPLDKWFVNRFDGTGFTAARHALFGELQSWAWNQGLLVDHMGDWWIATRAGVLQFRGVDRIQQLARASPVATYTTRDGLAADVVIRLFEDSRGDVWIATVGEGRRPNGLSRWERSTRTLQHYTEADGLPRLDWYYPSAFAEDHAGGVWIGLTGDGGLMRYHDGRFSRFAADHQLSVRNLLVDAHGRLWVATYSAGLGRVDTPTIDSPVFTWYTTADTLSSNEVGAVTDDALGRIYAGTARGIDRLDPTTSRVTRRYSIRDGLPAGEAQAALRDHRGGLWFSYIAGLVRLVPDGDRPAAPPPILLSGLRVNGEPHPISELGAVALPSMEVSSDRNQLQIDFQAVGFGPGDGVRYQYALEGTDQAWSEPGDRRSVTFARLAPGAYRFLVRALNGDGIASPAPASFAFTVLPPVWQRWWFVTLAAFAIAAGLYALHRMRMARVLEVAQMRTRIATDLHDDIGANLTTIAVLSEVARQQAGGGDAQNNGPLSSIATVARESVASMADIVWAINPERDRVTHLVRRMRAYAEDTCAARGIRVTFRAPDGSGDDKLGVDVRRGVFLIFKEAVNNAARHSRCASMRVALRIDDRVLLLEVHDDGGGFDLQAESDGNGLASMRRRARGLGARFEIVSAVGAGTTVRVVLPLSRSLAHRVRALPKVVGDSRERRR